MNSTRRPVARITRGPKPTEGLRALWVREFNDESAHQFAKDLAVLRLERQSILPLLINSWGGDVYALLAMVDLLGTFDGIVATIAVGNTMSCGTALFTCGAEGYRFASPKATFLIHDVGSEEAGGKVEDQKNNVHELDRLNAAVWSLMESNIGKPKGYLSNQHQSRGRTDWYLTAPEALKIGLVNKIGLPTFEVVTRYDPFLGIGV